MNAIGTYQDYFWFLGGLCWFVSGLAWWRLELQRDAWAWLPWSAAAGTIGAAAQVCCWMLVAEQPPLAPPLLAVDLFLGAIAAVQVAGWWWTAQSRHARERERYGRLLVGILGVAAAGCRHEWPQLGATALAASALCAALSDQMAGKRLSKSARVAMGATVASLVFSNWGPLAGTLFDSVRWADLAAGTAFLISAAQLAFAAVVLIAVLREPLRVYFERTGRQSRREAGIFATFLVGWLVIGLAIAYLASSSTRLEIETAALSRARTGALLVNKEQLAQCLGPEFHIDRRETFRRLEGGLLQRAFSDWLSPGRTQALTATLTSVAAANPDTSDVFIITLKDGWIVGVLFKERPKPKPNEISLERAATAQDYALWDERGPSFRGLHQTAYGTSVEAWAPLLTARNEMLGWLVLDWDPKRWIAAQAQSRLQTFAMVALGASLCVLLFLHRLVHRQREAVALQASAAATASRLKTTFLATVSHELRTPLQAIRGYGEILEGANQSITHRPLFVAMRNEIEVMRRLVADLLDLSAMEAGAFRCERHPVQIGKLMADIAAAGQRDAEAKGLGFRSEVAADLPDLLVGDAVRLRQLCGNLLSNAVKYTDDGEISLRVEVQHRDTDRCDFAVVVDDTGPGIPQERRAALFQPFSRLDVATAKEGSGLGLALASGLARNLGGELRLEQSGPEGSRFIASFRWPVAAPQPPPGGNTPPPQPDLHRRSVLVVDDSPVIGILFVEFLRSCGVRCDLAADGIAALDALRSGKYDAAVVDVSLPGIDGYEVARRLKGTDNPGRQTRLVGVSAHAAEDQRQTALRAGMDDFLSKPAELRALAIALGVTPSAHFRQAIPEILLAQLNQVFLRELPGQIYDMERALATRHWMEIARIAHDLANAAFALQAAQLNKWCCELEQAARNGDPSRSFELWNRIRAALPSCEHAREGIRERTLPSETSKIIPP